MVYPTNASISYRYWDCVLHFTYLVLVPTVFHIASRHTATIIEDPSGKQKALVGKGWVATVVNGGRKVLEGIANLPTRPNPHLEPAYIYDSKKMDDLYIDGESDLGMELVEGGYCRVEDNDLVAREMPPYHYRHNADDDEEYDDIYDYDEEEYDGTFAAARGAFGGGTFGGGGDGDDDNDDYIELEEIQINAKHEQDKRPWSSDKEYYQYIHNHAKQWKARGCYGPNVDLTHVLEHVQINRSDLCYNMTSYTGYLSDGDDATTMVWWIPARHPIAQMLLVNEKKEMERLRTQPIAAADDEGTYGDEGTSAEGTFGGDDDMYDDDDGTFGDDDDDDDSDYEAYYWWSCYDSVDSFTGSYVVFTNVAVQEALNTIMKRCEEMDLPIEPYTSLPVAQVAFENADTPTISKPLPTQTTHAKDVSNVNAEKKDHPIVMNGAGTHKIMQSTTKGIVQSTTVVDTKPLPTTTASEPLIKTHVL